MAKKQINSNNFLNLNRQKDHNIHNMTEASFIQYLDEEYQRIQEYLSSLVDTIPVINLDAVQVSSYFLKSLTLKNRMQIH